MEKHQFVIFLLTILLSTTACASDDAASIISHAINNTLIEPYYHTDTLPNRIPLRIKKNQLLKAEYALTKFGVPVVYVVDNPQLEFIQLEINKNKANIELRYLPEGVRLKMQLSKSAGDWKIVSNKLVEE